MTDNAIISGLTNAGARILSSAQIGEDIVFTKMKVGDGILLSSQNPANLTDLVNSVDNLEIENYEILTNDDNSVALKVSSFIKQAENSYYFRELGLFAIDPGNGQEVLYAYVNKGDNPTYIPQNSTNIAVHELASMIVAVSNKLNITVNCDNNRISILAREIGEIVASTLPITTANMHLLDGSILAGGGIYQQFVNYIKNLYISNPNAEYFTTEANWQSSVATYGVCGKFVFTPASGNDPATVRLPKITGIIEGTTDVTALGDLISAGLPNITGKSIVYLGDGTIQPASGALYEDDVANFYLAGTDFIRGSVVGLDASRSSSIYGNSNTVQPQTINVLYYIVVATSVKTSIQVDIDQIATDLNGKADTSLSNLNATGQALFTAKADTDLSNITATGKVLISSLGMPSAGYALSTLAQNTDYTAAESGYFYIQSQIATAPTYLYMKNSTAAMDVVYTMPSVGGWLNGYIPVAKGDKFSYSVGGSFSAVGFYFVKCKGD